MGPYRTAAADTPPQTKPEPKPTPRIIYQWGNWRAVRIKDERRPTDTMSYQQPVTVIEEEHYDEMGDVSWRPVTIENGICHRIIMDLLNELDRENL